MGHMHHTSFNSISSMHAHTTSCAGEIVRDRYSILHHQGACQKHLAIPAIPDVIQASVTQLTWLTTPTPGLQTPCDD